MRFSYFKYVVQFLCFVVLTIPVLQAETRPKLIVVIIVDQMRADYLDRFAPYENSGLHFFSTEGADFIHADYQHLPTETCVGHSVLLSGRNPEHTGIVGNEWYDRTTGKMEYCVADSVSTMIGGSGQPVSPRNLVGENFSDWLQASFPGARVYSLSLKDRAAILMGGHHPQGAFWFSHSNGAFVTSRYYAKELPHWVETFNSRHLADAYAGRTWIPLLSSDSPAYNTNEVASEFPHPMPKEPGSKLYDAVYGSPFGDELLEKFAETAINSNDLGKNLHGPDLLAVSFSSNDLVGHAYGPDSPEIADEQIRLDRTLGQLMKFVNTRIGKGNVLWALSADHGSEPEPEAEKALRHNLAAQRLPFADALQVITTKLNAIFHVSDDMRWFAAYTDTMLYFDTQALVAHHISLAAARHVLANDVHDVPGVQAFYDTTDLKSVKGWIGTDLRNSYFPARSPDVYYLTKEWTYFSSRPTGTSHADPWPYDSHAPFVIAGWNIEPRRITDEVQVTDLAPTLAELAGVHSPKNEVIDGRSRKLLLRFRGNDEMSGKTAILKHRTVNLP